MNPSYVSEEVPGLEGTGEAPDYIALVIEWGGVSDDDAVTTVSARAPDRGSMVTRKIATLVGALSAIALATWGLRRLRAVS